MKFGLIIIGDEIVQGNRTDAHFSVIKKILAERGLRLAWVEYLCDDRAELVARFEQSFQRSFAQNCPVLVTGGIGATPDDHTRQAAAQALGLPMALHPEAVKLIDAPVLKRGETDLNTATHQQRRQMANFVVGAQLIPNPFNGIAGFSIRQHYFMPGFPVMAHPMVEWVLDTYYKDAFFKDNFTQRCRMVYDLQESQLTPLMEAIERDFAGVQTYSLPTLGHYGEVKRYSLELGVKAEGDAVSQVDRAWEDLLARVAQIGGKFS
ncbi:MAG: pncC 2 [Burkholderiaceae bacterium]|nr:pncC 2 [Burkholderiaceae bacterium]